MDKGLGLRLPCAMPGFDDTSVEPERLPIAHVVSLSHSVCGSSSRAETRALALRAPSGLLYNNNMRRDARNQGKEVRPSTVRGISSWPLASPASFCSSRSRFGPVAQRRLFRPIWTGCPLQPPGSAHAASSSRSSQGRSLPIGAPSCSAPVLPPARRPSSSWACSASSHSAQLPSHRSLCWQAF